MGAYGTQITEPTPLADFIRREYPTVIRHSWTDGQRAVYCAYRTPEGETLGLVLALDAGCTPEPVTAVIPAGMLFWVKPMSEDMGPRFYDCPRHILDLLTPIEQMPEWYQRSYAADWRAKCRANADARHELPCPHCLAAKQAREEK